jgi:geranylgeranyl pyrophosphate synthase
VLDIIGDDLERVEALLRKRPLKEDGAVGAAVDYLIGGGGKRLRPALAILSAHLCSADLDRAVYAAAAAEMLHTATLVHDDLVDGSLLRRGVETLNVRWPPGATVLVGDYLFACSAHLVAQTGSLPLMQRFAEALVIICNGELDQMFVGSDGRLTRQAYQWRIYAKTAHLIALSAITGAVLADASAEALDALQVYGERVGLAFQIVDDVLDLVADETVLGKPVGSDLRQGLITLPVLLFMEQEPDHPLLQRALEPTPPQEIVQQAVQLVAGSPAIPHALEIAQGYVSEAQAALDAVPPSPYRTALLDLAEFVVRRQF